MTENVVARRATFLINLLALAGFVHGYLTWIAVRLPLEGTVAPPGAPWPLPQTWVNSTSLKTLDPTTISLTSNFPAGCDIISKAFERHREAITLLPSASRRNDGADDAVEQLTAVVVRADDPRCEANMYPTFGDNETYTITIDETDTAVLSASNVWGVLRGLETLSQLVYLTEDNQYRINQTTIIDYPRYSYRGLMIDTARHYYSVHTIVQILNTMAADKFNVLHWHIVDDQSFPFESKTFPNLSIHGAYTPSHVYTSDDVKTVISEARLRGIRVIPEFDTPGHTWSWGRAYPELITPCWGKGIEGGPYQPNYPLHGPAEIINPMLNSTYEFMDLLFREIAQVFPDNYIHLGMDEAYRRCWESNPNISDWMNATGLNDLRDVEQYYARRLIDIVQGIDNTQLIIWQDPIENNATVQNTTLIEVWKDTANSADFKDWRVYTKDVADKGYNMILSSPWYLNMITYGQDWKKYYQVDPDNFTDDASQQALIKGGEACVWSEYIDPTNFFSVVWPRASAVAERLWSSKSSTDVESAKFRLDQQRCRMVRRGIPAKPILNGYCGDYDWDMQRETGTSTTASSTSTTPLPSANDSARHNFSLRNVLLVALVTCASFTLFN